MIKKQYQEIVEKVKKAGLTDKEIQELYDLFIADHITEEELDYIDEIAGHKREDFSELEHPEVDKDKKVINISVSSNLMVINETNLIAHNKTRDNMSVMENLEKTIEFIKDLKENYIFFFEVTMCHGFEFQEKSLEEWIDVQRSNNYPIFKTVDGLKKELEKFIGFIPPEATKKECEYVKQEYIKNVGEFFLEAKKTVMNY